MTPIYDHDPTRRTNAQAIADLATLGILRGDDHVLDMTVGPEAGFWTRWRPEVLVTNDLDPNVEAEFHADVLDPGFAATVGVYAYAYDVVVWDPPYANRGTSRHAMDSRYGLGTYRTPAEVEQLLVDGTRVALDITSRLALVKCQDACVASRYRPQTFAVYNAATELGARLIAELYVYGARQQPAGKKQRNVWSKASTLLVFRKGDPQ